MKRVYLAGKCDPNNDWRGYYSREGWSPIYDLDRQDWRDADFTHSAGFICTGPFPTGCDHECAHSAQIHTAITCSGESRQRLLQQCMGAIDASDMVFAYIDTLDAFGTLVEIGYASARGKPVVACFANHLCKEPVEDAFLSDEVCNLAGDLWFAAAIATRIYFSDAPIARLVQHLRLHP